MNQIAFLVDLADFYPIMYDILWSLSFHTGIQEQLRSNEILRGKLERMEKTCSNDAMQKILFGLRWNLDSNLPSIDTHPIDKFDMMISYSHKDKEICGQIYDELLRRGYRVWIDFNEMHGNVMDAMAHAIEQSRLIILCISGEYQRSNYCRAEAQYAFKRQLKIVPIVVQKSYKPDGWLLFLISGLLYVDFIKYPFAQAVQMLLNEFQTSHRPMNPPLESLNEQDSGTASSVSLTIDRPREIREWTVNDVQQWLLEHKLFQMAQLLRDVNGSSLIYLTQSMSNSVSQDYASLFEQDSMQKTGRALSLIELARFRSLIDEELYLSVKVKRWYSNTCCPVMWIISSIGSTVWWIATSVFGSISGSHFHRWFEFFLFTSIWIVKENSHSLLWQTCPRTKAEHCVRRRTRRQTDQLFLRGSQTRLDHSCRHEFRSLSTFERQCQFNGNTFTTCSP